MQKFRTANILFLDLYISCYLYNIWKFFSNIKAKSINFVMVERQVIYIEKIGTIIISLADDNNIELHNIALVLRYNPNLTSFDYFQKSEIMY